ncbi:MAG: hypothetical protein JWO67_6974 [Streptosporangiaceae bacterium]|jgi:hypothetical protein|nr:hypothetical protein [Streptosporangiaceae bacterium]
MAERRGPRPQPGRSLWWRTAVSGPRRRITMPPRKVAGPRARAGGSGSRRDPARDRGSATAEIAVALPALVLVTVAAIWGVTVASADVRCVDAVRLGARAAARGEPLPAVRTVVAQAAPEGATVGVDRSAGQTRVEVTVAVRAPILSGLPALTLRAHAVAATEPGVTS